MSTTTKFLSNIFTLLTVIIALCALGISGFIYYKFNLYQRNVNITLTTNMTNNSLQINNLKMQILQLQTNANKINNKLDNITGSQTVLWQVNELINMATQSLTVYHDIPATIKLLTQASNRLTNVAQFVNLRYAIDQDLLHLNQVAPINQLSVYSALDNLTQHIKQLHASTSNLSPVMHVQSQHMNVWHIFVQHMDDTLKQLVAVSKPGIVPDLLPHDQALIIDAIMVELLNARLALITHDALNWHASIQRIKNLVSLNFTNDQQVTYIMEQLNQLNQVNVSIPSIQIDATLHQLIKLNNLYQ